MKRPAAGRVRHFEKKAKLNQFRRIATRGSTVHVTVGTASFELLEVPVKCMSAVEALAVEARWVRWVLDAGYGEVDLPDGVPGVVTALRTPRGPARVRIDSREDVHVPAPAIGDMSLRVAQRVVVAAPRRRPGLDPDFMFGSELESDRIAPFPSPRSWRSAPAADAGAAIRASLARDLADLVEGQAEYEPPLGELEPGTLMVGWHAGIHRFLKTGSLKQVPGHDRGPRKSVFYEAVLSSTFKRTTSGILYCVPQLCAPVPPAVVKELERVYGKGSLS